MNKGAVQAEDNSLEGLLHDRDKHIKTVREALTDQRSCEYKILDQLVGDHVTDMLEVRWNRLKRSVGKGHIK